MTRSQLPILIGAAVIGAAGTFLILTREGNNVDVPPEPASAIRARDTVEEPDAEKAKVREYQDLPNGGLDHPEIGQTEYKIEIPKNPEALLTEISKALEAGNMDRVGKLMGVDAFDEETKSRLEAMAASGKLKFINPDPIREVGEIELNARTRWALRMEGAESGEDQIFFNLVRDKDRWKVESLILPPKDGEPNTVETDSLAIADTFLQAALRQQFTSAKQYVDGSAISDAKIAGMCILFEDGGYQLRPNKSLRSMFQRDGAAGYMVHVMAGDGSEAAQFSLLLNKSDAGWQISEINLDRLLSDYAERFGDGDIYYSPLIKNPKGGDTLVLYFEFDSDQLSPRTERQLKIVAELLSSDPDKNLTISGYTDAMGTEAYNRALSEKRALSVKEFLVKSGVAEKQVSTTAEGQANPLRPNFTSSGEDNPEGRRANRRSEIYLDF